MSDVAGVSNATSGSITDKLTRDHRMTLDEAHLILNLKAGETIEQVLKVRELLAPVWALLTCTQSYEHLFQANGPPPAAKEAPRQGTRGSAGAPQSSHYLQSKVVRARERIEAEMKLAEESPPPPPPDPPKQDA
jgi:import inner membrane translocase subunit TIM16